MIQLTVFRKSLSESQIDSSEIDKLRLQAENARLQGYETFS